MLLPPDAFPLDLGNPTPTPLSPTHFRGGHLPHRLAAIAPLLLLAGCSSPPPAAKPDEALTSEGQALFGTSPDAGKPAPGKANEATWSIVIVAFRGPDQDAAANAGLAKARTVAGLREAYTRKEGNSTVIAYGHYTSPDAPDAQADLQRVHELNVDGGTPFAGAVLAPAPGLGSGRMPELDLRSVKGKFGRDALYTLQIAAYGRDDRKPPQNDKERAEFIRMAEDAAAALRREGEQAFYYHGPNMSLVTIGVFGPTDFDPQRPELRSDRLRAAEEAHPDNLLNGKGMKVRAQGVPANSPKAWRTAKSFLIAIPAEE